MAKEGNKQVKNLNYMHRRSLLDLYRFCFTLLKACTILAKQLIQLRKQETRSIAATSQISGIKTHTHVNYKRK